MQDQNKVLLDKISSNEEKIKTLEEKVTALTVINKSIDHQLAQRLEDLRRLNL